MEVQIPCRARSEGGEGGEGVDGIEALEGQTLDPLYLIPYFAKTSRTLSSGIACTVLSFAVTVVAAKSELWMDSSVASIAAWNSADACSFASSVVVSRVAFQDRRTEAAVEKAIT